MGICCVRVPAVRGVAMSGVVRRPVWASQLVRVLRAPALAAVFFLSISQAAQSREDRLVSNQLDMSNSFGRPKCNANSQGFDNIQVFDNIHVFDNLNDAFLTIGDDFLIVPNDRDDRSIEKSIEISASKFVEFHNAHPLTKWHATGSEAALLAGRRDRAPRRESAAIDQSFDELLVSRTAATVVSGAPAERERNLGDFLEPREARGDC
jgi:hypothetical protein